jgi:hypothetical protein
MNSFFEPEVPALVSVNNSNIYDITPCSPMKSSKGSEEYICHHLQGRRIIQRRNLQETDRFPEDEGSTRLGDVCSLLQDNTELNPRVY